MKNNLSFNFKETDDTLENKKLETTKKTIHEDKKEEVLFVEEKQENITISEIDSLKEDKDKDIDIKKEKHIRFNEDSEDYIPIALPGSNSRKYKRNNIKETIKNTQNKLNDSFRLEPIEIDKKDLFVSLISIFLIICIGVLIYISGSYIYKTYIQKQPEEITDAIEVYADEKLPFYHYKDCIHLKSDKRYIKLEESVAKELGFQPCNNKKAEQE